MRASNVVPRAVATGPRPPPRQAPAKGKEGRDARGPPRPARPAAPGGTGGNDRRRREQSVVERRVSAPPPPPPPPAAATTQLGAARSGTWKVEVQHHKLRLDRFIKLAVGGASETFVQRIIRAGCVTYNGALMKPADKFHFFVREGGTLVVRALPAADAEASLGAPASVPWASRILFEDDDVIAVDKPAGLAAVSAPADPASVCSALTAFLAARDGAWAPELRAVHRLDKETSGCLILAKNAEAAAALGAQFRRSGAVTKRYVALLLGRPAGPAAGVWSDLLEVTASGKAAVVPAGTEGGKSAKTAYEATETIGALATVASLRPTTGRMHQLRAQASHRGAPVLGDDRYGRGSSGGGGAPRPPRLCLHCEGLALAHPTQQGARIELRAPLPTDMASFIDALRRAAAAAAAAEEEGAAL